MSGEAGIIEARGDNFSQNVNGTHNMNAFLTVVEVLIKCFIGLITGGGVGALVFGIGLIKEGVTDFTGSGPPLGPVFIGVGAGLLSAALIMVLLFVGPFSRRRWFISAPAVVEEQPKKWTM